MNFNWRMFRLKVALASLLASYDYKSRHERNSRSDSVCQTLQ